MFISIDLPDDVVRAVDEAVRARVADYLAQKPAQPTGKKPKPKYRALTQKERGKAALIAQKEGAAAANAWIKATTLEPQEPDAAGEAPRRGAGRPRDYPSRRLVIEEALRLAFQQKKEG